ncbi:hypothetical protein BDV3_003992 [Batrachochytrium dendrobatidis]
MSTTLDEYKQLANMSVRGACPRCNGFGFFHSSLDKHDRPATQRCKKCAECSVCDGSGVTVGVIGCRRCNGRGFSHNPRAIVPHTIAEQMRCFDCEECKECKGEGVLDSKRFQDIRRASLSAKQNSMSYLQAMPSSSSINLLAGAGGNIATNTAGGTLLDPLATDKAGNLLQQQNTRGTILSSQSDSLKFPPMVPDLAQLGPLTTTHMAIQPATLHPHMMGIFGVQIDQTIFDAMMAASMTLSESVPLSQTNAVGNAGSGGISGATRKPILADQVSTPCPRCEGTGFRHDSSARHDSKKKAEKCKHCTPCKGCQGTGTIVGKKGCDTCEMKGFVHGTTEREHDVPAHLRCFFCKDCRVCRGLGIVKIGSVGRPVSNAQQPRMMLRQPEDRLA